MWFGGFVFWNLCGRNGLQAACLFDARLYSERGRPAMQVLQFRVEMEYVAAAVEGGGWGEPKTKLR